MGKKVYAQNIIEFFQKNYHDIFNSGELAENAAEAGENSANVTAMSEEVVADVVTTEVVDVVAVADVR